MFERAQQELRARKDREQAERLGHARREAAPPVAPQTPPESVCPVLSEPARSPSNPVDDLKLVFRRFAVLAVARVDEERVYQAEVDRLLADRRRLVSEVGPAFAEALERQVMSAFRFETARCGRCGRLGHDGPEPEGR